MALIQQLISESKYNVKCPYSMTPKGICIHNTGNDASAKNEIAYMQNNNNEVSFHIAVDDKEAIQGIPFNRNTWHSGDGGNGEGNRNYISVEICYSLSGGEKFDKAEVRASKEIALLMKQYGFTITNIKRHFDFSGKNCPQRTMKKGWNRFLNMIQSELNALNSSSNTKELYRVRKSWEDAKSQIGAYSNLDNAIKQCKEGYKVFNSKGEVVYPTNITNATSEELYRIRKSWNDTSSQIGAYKNLESAKAQCKEGYSVFNSKGQVVYSKPVPVINKQYLNLKPHVPTWRIYPLDKAPVIGNEIGKLAPQTYGGLSYEILEKKPNDIYIIPTSMFGKVQIYAPRDNDSSITSYKVYNN